MAHEILSFFYKESNRRTLLYWQRLRTRSQHSLGAYNAVVEYVDHYRVDYNEQPDHYLNSILFGSGKKIKDIAFNEALKLAA